MKILMAIVVAAVVAIVLLQYAQRSKVDRPLDGPSVAKIDPPLAPGDRKAGFFLDTSGDQGCFENCPKPGLGVWFQRDDTELRQLFMNCDQVGHGDAFIDGAQCDDKSFYLEYVHGGVIVLDAQRQEVLRMTADAIVE